MTKKILLFFIFILLSANAYSITVTDNELRDAVKKTLFEYFNNPSNSTLNIDEIKDLLGFFLTIPTGRHNVNLSSTGNYSHAPIDALFVKVGSISVAMPKCPDETDYGTCSNVTIGKYCYAGRLVDKRRCLNTSCENESCSLNQTSRGQNNLSIYAKGDAAFGAWPHILVRINNQTIGESDVISADWKEYSFDYDGEAYQNISSVDIVFTNDIWLCWIFDRNLYVANITIDGETIATDDIRFIYDLGEGENAFDGDKIYPGTSNMRKNGALRFLSSEIICADSDQGIDYFTSGKTTAKSGTYNDYCDGNRINEYSCSNNGASVDNIDCEYGCSYGKCNKKPGDLIVQARGAQKCDGSKIEARINNNVIASIDVWTQQWNEYSFYYNGTIQNVEIAYSNTNGSSEDIQVSYIIANGKKIYSNDSSVKYDLGYGDAAFDGINIIPGQAEMNWSGALKFELAGSIITNDSCFGSVSQIVAPYCGNVVCDNDESCYSCPTDCTGCDFSFEQKPHGGSAENALLIINPAIPESVYIGNYYKNARKIPDRNVVYMNPSPDHFTVFVNTSLNALFGVLKNRNIDDHIDYILIAPLAQNSRDYRIGWGKSPLNTIFGSIGLWPVTTAYSYAFVWNESTYFQNQYGYKYGFGSNNEQYSSYSDPLGSVAFDNSFYWNSTKPIQNPPAGKNSRYYISSLIGYTGIRGNTLDEITSMIDRSVNADGTHPNGTFYFLKTGDIRSSCRFGSGNTGFEKAVSSITNLGGNATWYTSYITTNKHDILGVMVGYWTPGIRGANMTIQPGAFADHLTSYAGILGDISYAYSQEPMTDWIARGASGTAGTIVEPGCVGEKFPGIFFHKHYYEGLSLGEAFFRTVTEIRHTMLYGDPLTRPFGYLPIVNVDIPNGTLSGNITILPKSTTNNPLQVSISHHHIYVDGLIKGIVKDGNSFNLDTAALSDGFHDIRVVSYEDSNISTPGRWVGRIETNNHCKAISLEVSPKTGDLSTLFEVNAIANRDVSQIRLLQNNKVIAASNSSNASFVIPGFVLGGASVEIIAEAEFMDSSRALSKPSAINISYNNTPRANSNTLPIAFNYTKYAINNQSILVELPAIDIDEQLDYTILQYPNQARLVTFNNKMPMVLLQPKQGASGFDFIRFRAISSSGSGSSEGNITVRYTSP